MLSKWLKFINFTTIALLFLRSRKNVFHPHQVVIITVYKHKTAALGPAYLTIYDMRLVKILELYVEHVRPRFLKLHPDKFRPLNPKDGKLTIFLDKEGKRCEKINYAVAFFKKQLVDAGQSEKYAFA